MADTVHKCEILAAKIQNLYANVRAGTRLPSIRKVAEKANVSSQVVSQAYKLLCKRGYCTASARSGIYWNALSPNRQEQNKYRIACVLRVSKDQETNPKSVQMVQSFDHYAWCMLKDLGHEPILFKPIQLSESIIADSLLDGIDGWLISCMGFDLDSHPEWLQYPPRPTVLFRHQSIANYPVSQVLPDHYSGIREMFREAAEFDLKEMTIITPHFESCVARGKICAEIAEENNVKVNDFIIKPNTSDFTAIGKKLAGKIKGQLVFCCSDLPAFDLYQGFCQKGLVPCRDFHFVSDDDVEGLGVRPLEIPTLSEITYSRKLQVELAVHLLLKNIREQSNVTRIELVPTHFVRRISGLVNRDQTKGNII